MQSKDFQTLCEKAIDACPGATEIIGYEKKEGAFDGSLFFKWTMGTVLLPEFPSGPRRLVTNSKVATMAYDGSTGFSLKLYV